MEIPLSGNRVLKLLIGDITKIPADAIANAANSGLRGGGGVDGAIHRGGGPTLMQELEEIRTRQGGCPTGSAVATSAGRLPAKWVFHAVGPVYRDGRHGEPDALRSCYRACMELAAEYGAKSISFPAISTGVYGYPVEEAALVAVDTVSSELLRSPCVELAIFVLFNQPIYQAFERAASRPAASGGAA